MINFKNLIVFIRRFLRPVVDFRPKNMSSYFSLFLKDYWVYRSLPGAEPIRFRNVIPIIDEKTAVAVVDHHYFYQGIWAAGKIIQSRVPEHVDIGSQKDLIGFLTTVTKVKFVDIRPLAVALTNFENIKGSICNLPFLNNSVSSLSCLHVAEHIGLGRYGDRLDPYGTKKACAELSRVLVRGGNLYFSVPIGRERLCFNAHRIHWPETILDYFADLNLIEFSVINDKGNFLSRVNPTDFRNSSYACGLFHFTKL